MLIAREKKKTNIAEYILYMWQLEAMLRALGLDIQQVNEKLISRYQVDQSTAQEMYDWYENLIEMMRLEKVEKSGHIQVLKNTVNELNELHFFLLHEARDMRYQQIVTQAAANLVEFRAKSGVDETVGDVELALNALYGILMLRLEKKEISVQTEQATRTFSNMIAYLAARYKKMEEEEKN